MKLLIISNMSHYHRDGELVGWGPTVQELNHLATLFDEVRHVGCLHDTPAPASSLPYTAANLTLVPLPPAGGARLRDKLAIVGLIPRYLRTILRELPRADVVHVRCPANIPMLACLILALKAKPRARWIKYAGNWQPTGPEALSYRFQRWWLRKGFARGLVTVNGNWPDQPPYVRAFNNPSLTDAEADQGARLAASKSTGQPVRLLFVGRAEPDKGVGRCLEIVRGLRDAGVDAELDIIGDGPHRAEFEVQARSLGVADVARFHGWLPRTILPEFYGRAHFMLLPSTCSEGWPKVLSEAMAYGAVPVASTVSSIPEILRTTNAGISIDPNRSDLYVDCIAHLARNPEEWLKLSKSGVDHSRRFTYTHYLSCVKDLLGIKQNAG